MTPWPLKLELGLNREQVFVFSSTPSTGGKGWERTKRSGLGRHGSVSAWPPRGSRTWELLECPLSRQTIFNGIMWELLYVFIMTPNYLHTCIFAPLHLFFGGISLSEQSEQLNLNTVAIEETRFYRIKNIFPLLSDISDEMGLFVSQSSPSINRAPNFHHP